MCGICGIVSANGPADPERLARMSAKLLHRGPDSDGIFADGPAALAARRLAIIDLETGDQPIANEDGTVHGLYLVDDLLVKTDRASMAHSLEARVPFLDPAVTNLALALRTRHRVHGLRKKVLLRKAVAPLVPSRIVRGKKRGFSIPAAAWLRGELEPFARATLNGDTLHRQGFFRPEAVTALIDRHVAGEEDLSRQLWGLLAFTLWHERHVEREPQALREPRLEAPVH